MSAKILFFSDGRSALSESQRDPFRRLSGELRKRLGLRLEARKIDGYRRLGLRDVSGFDAIALKFDYRTPEQEVLSFADEVANLRRQGVIRRQRRNQYPVAAVAGNLRCLLEEAVAVGFARCSARL